jgi:hypothetical protein
MTASSKKYQYSIAWSAKSGCTLFRRLFLSLHQDELSKGPTNQWHQLAVDFPFQTKFKKAILLCRNPYSRAVSAFINKMCGGRGHNSLSKIIKLDQVSFKNFLLYLLEHKSELNKINIHIAPQFHSLNRLESHKIFKIKLENFDKEIIDAYNYFDLQELIPHIKTFLSKPNQYKNISQRNDDDFFCGETVYSINDTVFPKFKYFYNDELRELVQKIYPEDFKNFNYSFYYE